MLIRATLHQHDVKRSREVAMVLRRLQEAINELFAFVRSSVIQKGSRLVGRRRHPSQIQRGTAEKFGICGRRDLQASGCSEFAIDQLPQGLLSDHGEGREEKSSQKQKREFLPRETGGNGQGFDSIHEECSPGQGVWRAPERPTGVSVTVMKWAGALESRELSQAGERLTRTGSSVKKKT
jgi:hypothetical protein